MKNYLFTSESVSEGHPDKMADQISDSILDAILAKDPRGRVACETLLARGLCVIAGEITTNAQIDFQEVAREAIKKVGYDSAEKGFDYHSCAVINSVGRQSPDIAMGVNTTSDREQGAGDQGIMFGYAIDESPELMPLTISYSHQLVRELAKLRKNNTLPFILPDAKSQVTVEYKDGVAARIDAIVISTQHTEAATNQQIEEAVRELVIKKVIPAKWIDAHTKFYINPTGRFVLGGPHADCGLTGRKIIVDTYGGHGSHGGGAFSGKDPSKVDRSAAYGARHVAKNIVAAGLAKRCMVQVAYAIGVAEPVSIMIQDFGTSTVPNEVLAKAVRQVWSLKPAALVEQFDLLKPKYAQTAAYGHFGRNEEGFTWELTNKVDALKDAVQTLKRT
jgi:S-adenosylmethionine synthetase